MSFLSRIVYSIKELTITEDRLVTSEILKLRLLSVNLSLKVGWL